MGLWKERSSHVTWWRPQDHGPWTWCYKSVETFEKVHECILYTTGRWITVIRRQSAIDCLQEKLNNSSHSWMFLSQCDFAALPIQSRQMRRSHLEFSSWDKTSERLEGSLTSDFPVLSRNKSLRKASTIANLGSKNSHQLTSSNEFTKFKHTRQTIRNYESQVTDNKFQNYRHLNCLVQTTEHTCI